jgi:hypothetical protein
MDSHDQDLGMGRKIYPRDFLNGVALAIGVSAAPRALWAQNAGPDTSAQEPLLAQGITPSDPRYYPPELTGTGPVGGVGDRLEIRLGQA